MCIVEGRVGFFFSFPSLFLLFLFLGPSCIFLIYLWDSHGYFLMNISLAFTHKKKGKKSEAS